MKWKNSRKYAECIFPHSQLCVAEVKTTPNCGSVKIEACDLLSTVVECPKGTKIISVCGTTESFFFSRTSFTLFDTKWPRSPIAAQYSHTEPEILNIYGEIQTFDQSIMTAPRWTQPCLQAQSNKCIMALEMDSFFLSSWRNILWLSAEIFSMFLVKEENKVCFFHHLRFSFQN